MAIEPIDVPRTEQPRRWWAVPLSWSVLISIALVVYEITDQSGLAAAIGCSKFGWRDILTARWLRRVDPDRPRGRVCFCFYVASALWKITLAAFAVIAIIALAEAYLLNPQVRQQRGNWAPAPTFIGGVITTVAGLTLAVLAGYIALGCSLRSGRKVWLDWAVHRARKEGAWPPPYRQWNYAGLMLTVTFGITEVGMMVLAIYFLGLFMPPGPILATTLLGLLLFLILAGPGITGPLEQKAVAHDPAECWPENETEMS